MSDLQPMTLLDLDSAGLDPTRPAPPDFMLFLFENSQDGYLTLWSHLLSEPDGASIIQRWIDDAVAAYHARTLKTQMAPAAPEKPSGDHVTEITYEGPVMAPPVNVNVPMLSGAVEVGSTLTCTMGNWQGEPDSYAYQFKSDGADVSGTDNTYVTVAGDAGKSITCVVTATNAGGSTTAPPSNAILVTGAAADATRSTRRTAASADVGSGDDTAVSRSSTTERGTR
jgi:hypothetical protein